MRKLLAAITLLLLTACVSQAPYRHTEGTGAYVSYVPAYYEWPLVYRSRSFPGWYGGYPYYAYWGFPSPWGFYYYSPNFYPYHFSVAYSLWPDFYGGWYGLPAPWCPPYRGYWHPHTEAASPPGVRGAYGISGTFPTRANGSPVRGSRTVKSTGASGLDALYGKGTAYYGRNVAGSYPGKPGVGYPSPANAVRPLTVPSARSAPPPGVAAPAIRAMSPARGRNPAGRPVNPSKPAWQKP